MYSTYNALQYSEIVYLYMFQCNKWFVYLINMKHMYR